MCFLLLISLSDSTVVTKENLHLKKKLTTMSVTMKINLYLHVTGIWLKNFLTWEKRLLIRTVFVSIVIKTELSTWSSIAETACILFVAYLHVSAAFVTKQKSLGWNKTSKRKWTLDLVESIGRKDELNIHRWKENNVTLLFRAWVVLFLHYFYFHCLKLLFNVCLVWLRRYRRTQVSRTVPCVLMHTGAIRHEFLGEQPKIQSLMRPVSR